MAQLVILLLAADPHLLEGGQQGQDEATNPHRVFALQQGNDLDLHCAGGQGHDLFLQPVRDAKVHGGLPRHHSVGIEVLANVDVTLNDGVEHGLMDATGLHTEERRLEEASGHGTAC